eukprot:5432722-Amphidinium_carterae.1
MALQLRHTQTHTDQLKQPGVHARLASLLSTSYPDVLFLRDKGDASLAVNSMPLISAYHFTSTASADDQL